MFITRNSLPARVFIVVCVISLLAVTTTLSSGLLAWVSQNDAAAINTAGSVRMATYRMSWQLATHFQHDELKNGINTPISAIGVIKRSLNSELYFLTQSELNKIELTNKKINDNSSLETGVKTNQEVSKRALILDMQNRLNALSAYQASLLNRDDSAITAKLNYLQNSWKNELKPLFLTNNQNDFYDRANSYVIQVNQLVQMLQLRNESRQFLLLMIQSIALLITLVVLAIGLYELYKKVLSPMNELNSAMSEFKQGQFDRRVTKMGYDEFNRLSTTFNYMAETISDDKYKLEHRVSEKTRHLTKANSLLGLLFDVSKQLALEPVTINKLDELLKRFVAEIPDREILICIQQDDNYLLNRREHYVLVLSGRGEHYFYSEEDYQERVKRQQGMTWLYSYPLNYHQQSLGELHIFEMDSEINNQTKGKENIEKLRYIDRRTESALLMALANLIGTAVSLKRQRAQDQQVLLLKERSTIARELHDSLAQSLSYLKIQVFRLEKLLQKQNSDSQVLEVTDTIKGSLSGAYHQLRELLKTFRLKIESSSLDVAIENASLEFAERGGFKTTVNNNLLELILNASEQIDILQIIREALSNCVRHAQASRVLVNLWQEQREVYIVIVDNGIGIDGNYDTQEHHGLLIMQERANVHGSQLELFNNKDIPEEIRENIFVKNNIEFFNTGACILVKFTPEFFLVERIYKEVITDDTDKK